jgi:hypothetical protein
LPETDAERIARETAEVEAVGHEWAARSDEFLVGYVSAQRPSQFHTPAIVEMQRRLGAAVRASEAAADRQALAEHKLSRGIYWLTVWLMILAVVQTGATIWSAFFARGV